MVSAQSAVVDRLQRLSGGRDQRASERLRLIQPLLGDDMEAVERALTLVPATRDVQRGALHLLTGGGKRLRPICLMLASKLGTGFSDRARDLAVAAELVHSATLLHDDVVDAGVSRRGAPTARMIYGNAISIFAGDWLLVDALRRVRRSSSSDVLERLLDVIDEMIVAESLQLERRGHVAASFEDWLAVATGKTAALFRWALYAGARAGDLSLAQSAQLEHFGCELGLAFQAIDDVLDLAGDATVTGKALFADLREGKGSLPVVLAVRADPTLASAIAEVAAGLSVDAYPAVAARIEATGAIEEARQYAACRTAAALDALDAFSPSPARDALAEIARGLTARAV